MFNAFMHFYRKILQFPFIAKSFVMFIFLELEGRLCFFLVFFVKLFPISIIVKKNPCEAFLL